MDCTCILAITVPTVDMQTPFTFEIVFISSEMQPFWFTYNCIFNWKTGFKVAYQMKERELKFLLVSLPFFTCSLFRI
jgi:hypothetical protein